MSNSCEKPRECPKYIYRKVAQFKDHPYSLANYKQLFDNVSFTTKKNYYKSILFII